MLNYEYELKSYIDYEILYINLMQKVTKKSKTKTQSKTRESLITQLLMDNFNMEINKDKRFKDYRKIFFYVITYSSAKDNKEIKSAKILEYKPIQEVEFEVNEIKYNIILQENSSFVKKRITNEEGIDDFINLKSKSKTHDNLSSLSTESEKDNNIFYFRKFMDQIGEDIYILSLRYTSHEVDGNIISKEDVDLKNGLADNLYYPKIEKDNGKKEGNSSEEDDDKTKIKKNTKILIETKQNASLLILFEQMEKTIKDFKILLENETFYYFGFVNDSNAKEGIDEKNFEERIKKFEKDYKLKIFLFIIKDNTLFDLKLEDKADYSLFFRNEMKNEITGMKNEISEMKNEMKNEISEMNSKLDSLRDMISHLLEKDAKKEKKNKEDQKEEPK